MVMPSKKKINDVKLCTYFRVASLVRSNLERFDVLHWNLISLSGKPDGEPYHRCAQLCTRPVRFTLNLMLELTSEISSAIPKSPPVLTIEDIVNS